MQITELRRQKGKKQMYSVFLDGNFACSLDEYTIYKNKLTVGADIDKQFLEEAQQECMQDSAFNSCLDLLSKTLKTKKQIAEYLQKKGYMPKTIQCAIDKLEEYGYINDKYYAESYVNVKSNYNGKYKLKNELKLKGVSDEIIDETLNTLENQEDVILNIALKYIKNKQKTPELISKLSRHLASKGFMWDEINNVIYKIKRQENLDDDWQWYS